LSIQWFESEGNSDDRPSNGLRISRGRGAPHQKASKSLESRALEPAGSSGALGGMAAISFWM